MVICIVKKVFIFRKKDETVRSDSTMTISYIKNLISYHFGWVEHGLPKARRENQSQFGKSVVIHLCLHPSHTHKNSIYFSVIVWLKKKRLLSGESEDLVSGSNLATYEVHDLVAFSFLIYKKLMCRYRLVILYLLEMVVIQRSNETI